MANTIVGVKQAISGIIDEVYNADAKTAMWKANPAIVRGFDHAKTGQVLGVDVDGMVDYDRSGGYAIRSVTDTWADVELKHDRSAKVMMDQVDLMDEAQLPTIGAIVNEFVKNRVIPEVDATRVQDVCQSMSGAGATHYVTGYTPAKSTILGKIDDAIQAIQNDTGIDEGIQILFNSGYSSVLKQAEGLTRSMSVKDQGTAIQTRITEIDGNPITYIPSARMYSELEFYTSATVGNSKAGWAPKGTKAGSVTAKEVIAVLSVPGAAQAVTAHEVTKLFTADENPDADAAFMAYRTYHGAFVLPNKKAGVVVITK